MATAEHAVVYRETIQTAKEEVVRLDLSRREAEALFAITRYVGGDPDNSPRGDIGEIYDALENLGISTYKNQACDLCYTTYGGIYFGNYPKETAE